PARFDWHAQKRKRLFTHQCCAQLRAAFLDIFVYEQWLARLDDLAGESLAHFQRIKRLSDLIWEVNKIRLLVEQCHVDDIRFENLPHLTPDELDHVIEFSFRHQSLTHCADGRKLGSALFGLFEQALGLIEETGVFESNTHRIGEGLEQPHVCRAESVLSIDILEADRPPNFIVCYKRHN